MLRVVVFLAAAAVMLLSAVAAQAAVVIVVDKAAQRLTVTVDGQPRYEWPVSTGRWGYRTPNGNYRPERLERQWYSRKYDWSPMPHSIFFHHGYAIHGSNEVSRLGRPASHGCIRLHPKNAATLFSLVQSRFGSTRIVVTGDAPVAAVRLPARDYTRRESRRSLRYTGERRGSAQGFADVFYGDRR